MHRGLRKMATTRNGECSSWNRVRISGCGLLLVLLACGRASAEQLEISLEGLNEQLQEAVRSNLSLEQYVGRDMTAAQIRRLYNLGAKEITASLEPYGYYRTQVDTHLEETPKGFKAVYRITLGDPVIVRQKKVEVKGSGAELRSVRGAVRRFKPAEGERFDHGQYEASKDGVQQALLTSGYLRAWTPVRKVEVSRSEGWANIDVEWLTGDRYKFGQVGFQGAQFPEDFLERYIPWKPGEWYSSDKLLEFQQRLIDADYFATVLVEPVLEKGRPEGVPINVELAPAKRTIYSAGVYYSTDTGPGVRAGLQRRWINKEGHKFSVDLDNAQRLENYGVKYNIPLPGPNDRSLNFGASYRDENTDTSQSRNTRVAANETRQWLGWTRTLGLQFLSGSFQIADQDGSSTLLFAEGTLSRRSARNYAFPRNGYSLAFGTRFAPESTLTDTSFSQFTVDAKWIKGIARRQRLLTRASLGTMAVADFDQLPPELRFFAGGDRSIRGFDYQQLGSKNADGDVIGGTYLAVGSAEYEYYFLQDWGAVVFVDGGDAFRTAEFDLNVGAGVGARWRSPVGVVRVDFGIPVKSEEPHKLRFHITIGPDL
jgi:translocation and assembly module TamA